MQMEDIREPSDIQSEEQLIVNEAWRSFFMGDQSSFHRVLKLFRSIPSSPRCKVCFAPFKGPGSIVMRAMKRTPAKMNPNICGMCEEYTQGPGRGGNTFVVALRRHSWLYHSGGDP